MIPTSLKFGLDPQYHWFLQPSKCSQLTVGCVTSDQFPFHDVFVVVDTGGLKILARDVHDCGDYIDVIFPEILDGGRLGKDKLDPSSPPGKYSIGAFLTPFAEFTECTYHYLVGICITYVKKMLFRYPEKTLDILIKGSLTDDCMVTSPFRDYVIVVAFYER